MVGKMVPGFLLNEVADYSNLNYLVEAKEDRSKSYKIRGIFMESGKKNRNGRIYPKEILEREVNNYYKEFVVTKRAISRLDHPKNDSTLLLSEACHIIEDLKMDGDVAIGCAKILDTPQGRIAKTLMDEGIQLAVSSRGLGSIDDQGVVGDNFKLIGIDLVSVPSCPVSFVESVMENQQYIIDGDRLVAVNMDKFKKDLSKNGSRNLYNDLNKFLTSLSRKI
jgi:hypothetical protein